MKTFRIHYRLNSENQTIDIESKSAQTARENFLGRFDEGDEQPIVKKIKVVTLDLIASLSRRQKQIYAFVVEYVARSDESPTWQEIADGLEFKSKDQAFNCAKPLFKRGILGKSESASRSIKVLIQQNESETV